ncbi:MAG: hypothetical protein ACK5HO_08690 [Pseudomonadota bacterium]
MNGINAKVGLVDAPHLAQRLRHEPVVMTRDFADLPQVTVQQGRDYGG